MDWIRNYTTKWKIDSITDALSDADILIPCFQWDSSSRTMFQINRGESDRNSGGSLVTEEKDWRTEYLQQLSALSDVLDNWNAVRNLLMKERQTRRAGHKAHYPDNNILAFTHSDIETVWKNEINKKYTLKDKNTKILLDPPVSSQIADSPAGVKTRAQRSKLSAPKKTQTVPAPPLHRRPQYGDTVGGVPVGVNASNFRARRPSMASAESSSLDEPIKVVAARRRAPEVRPETSLPQRLDSINRTSKRSRTETAEADRRVRPKRRRAGFAAGEVEPEIGNFASLRAVNDASGDGNEGRMAGMRVADEEADEEADEIYRAPLASMNRLDIEPEGVDYSAREATFLLNYNRTNRNIQTLQWHLYNLALENED